MKVLNPPICLRCGRRVNAIMSRGGAFQHWRHEYGVLPLDDHAATAFASDDAPW